MSNGYKIGKECQSTICELVIRLYRESLTCSASALHRSCLPFS
jgi:hypothetical protein